VGRLHQSQFLKAFTLLDALQHACTVATSPLGVVHRFLPTQGWPVTAIRILSSAFFATIPHTSNTKNNKFTLLSTHDAIREKVKMVQQLEMCSNSMAAMFSSPQHSHEALTVSNCHDLLYKSLETSIEQLRSDQEEWQQMTAFVETNQTQSDGRYYKPVEVYRITNEQQQKCYNQNHASKKSTLLFHGSNKLNFPGILKNGLLIAPACAPDSGALFGKGLYFSDQVTKSVNYCRADFEMGEHAYMLICQVATGQQFRVTDVNQSLTKSFLNSVQKDSVSVAGTWSPCLDTHYTSRSTTIPQGELTPHTEACVDSYINGQQQPQTKHIVMADNEYIVYDKTQVVFRYVVKLERRQSVF
jgi:hypothetical protein